MSQIDQNQIRIGAGMIVWYHSRDFKRDFERARVAIVTGPGGSPDTMNITVYPDALDVAEGFQILMTRRNVPLLTDYPVNWPMHDFCVMCLTARSVQNVDPNITPHGGRPPTVFVGVATRVVGYVPFEALAAQQLPDAARMPESDHEPTDEEKGTMVDFPIEPLPPKKGKKAKKDPPPPPPKKGKAAKKTEPAKPAPAPPSPAPAAVTPEILPTRGEPVLPPPKVQALPNTASAPRKAPREEAAPPAPAGVHPMMHKLMLHPAWDRESERFPRDPDAQGEVIRFTNKAKVPVVEITQQTSGPTMGLQLQIPNHSGKARHVLVAGVRNAAGAAKLIKAAADIAIAAESAPNVAAASKAARDAWDDMPPMDGD